MREALKNRQNIIAAFQERSVSYFEDNYVVPKNSERMRRLRLVESLLQKLVLPGMKILEVGAGPAVLSEVIAKLAAKYIPLDLSIANLSEGKKRLGALTGLTGDVIALPLRDHCVDGTVTIGCLEYVPELKVAIHEICRVVRSGGFIIASFANLYSPRRWWDETLVHPFIRLKKACSDENNSSYQRYLSSPAKTCRAFKEGNARVEMVLFSNSGLLGYPFSTIKFFQEIQTVLSQEVEMMKTLSSEFLILARKQE